MFNLEIDKIEEIWLDLKGRKDIHCLTKLQSNYIIRKTDGFLNYWYEEVLRNPKVYISLNNNAKMRKSDILKTCMYLRYMPNSQNKGLLFKNMMSFIKHHKNKFRENEYKYILNRIIKSALHKFYYGE